MSKLTTTWWIIFYKDQLLLKKQITDFQSLVPGNLRSISLRRPTYMKYVCWMGIPVKRLPLIIR